MVIGLQNCINEALLPFAQGHKHDGGNARTNVHTLTLTGFIYYGFPSVIDFQWSCVFAQLIKVNKYNQFCF